MTHDEAKSLLDPYLDGELDAGSALALETHIASCPECRMRLEARRDLLTCLHAAALRYAPPHGLEARIRARARLGRFMSDRALAWPAAIAASLLLVVGGFLVGRTMSGSTALDNDLVSAHVRSVLSLHEVDVASSDHHTVKPWLAAALPFSPPVPELAETGDALLGARVDFVHHTRVAALVYRHGQHTVDVFIWPRTSGLQRPAIPASVDGYRVQSVSFGDFRAAIVSDMTSEELTAFCERWSAAAR